MIFNAFTGLEGSEWEDWCSTAGVSVEMRFKPTDLLEASQHSSDGMFYPDPLEAVQGEAVALLHHTRLSGRRRGGMQGRSRRRWRRRLRALAAAVRHRGDPLAAHHVRGDVVVVHVEQQTDDIEDVEVEEDHDDHEVGPGADAAPLDVQAGRGPEGRQEGGRLVIALELLLLLEQLGAGFHDG